MQNHFRPGQFKGLEYAISSHICILHEQRLWLSKYSNKIKETNFEFKMENLMQFYLKSSSSD